MNEKEWTARHEAFCLEYVKHGNASEAWRVAHPESKAVDKTVWSRASEMLKQSKVQARIDALKQETSQRMSITLERWEKEVSRIAFADPRRLMHADGRPKMLHELDEDIAGAIKAVKVGIDGIEYQFWDKNVSLGNAGKFIGSFERDNKQKAEPINALAAAVLGGVVGVTFDQPDDEEGEEE